MSSAPAYDPTRLGPPAGSVVSVIGGCGGMGRPLVRALVDSGVTVALMDLPRSIEQNRPPSDVWSHPIDCADEGSVRTAFAAVRAKFGRLDGCVNLAGFFKHWVRIADLPSDGFDEIIAGNLRGHYLCAREALPLLRESGRGSLVSVASTMAMDVVRGYTHYGAAKAGVVALVKGLARENAPLVRVNAVAPGLTRTAFLQGGTGRDKVFEEFDLEAYGRRSPMRRIAEPEDMTGPVMFLLGPASGFVNGETLIVDGGVYTQ